MTIMHFWEADDTDHRRQRTWSVDAPDDIGPNLGIGLGTPNGEIVAIEWNPDRSGTYTTDTGYREMFGPLHHEVDIADDGTPVLLISDGREVQFANPTPWRID